MNWIDVNTQLPKNCEQVLVLVEGYFMTRDKPLCQETSHRIFQGTFNRQQGWDSNILMHGCVVYWMPLPTPPTEIKADRPKTAIINQEKLDTLTPGYESTQYPVFSGVDKEMLGRADDE